MELRIHRDAESQRDVRPTVTEDTKASPPANGEGAKGAPPAAVVSVDVAFRQVEAENLQAAGNRVRDPAIAVQLARQIRTQISVRSEDAVWVQMGNVTPRVLRTLLDSGGPEAPIEAGA